jgi:hypothetical protein
VLSGLREYPHHILDLLDASSKYNDLPQRRENVSRERLDEFFLVRSHLMQVEFLETKVDILSQPSFVLPQVGADQHRFSHVFVSNEARGGLKVCW